MIDLRWLAIEQFPPTVAGILNDALMAWASGPRMVCKHLIADNRVPVLCAAHPNEARCPACSGRHHRTHDRIVELTCDECGTYDADGVHGIVAPCRFPGPLEVRDNNGRVGALYGALTGGVGICGACGRGVLGKGAA